MRSRRVREGLHVLEYVAKPKEQLFGIAGWKVALILGMALAMWIGIFAGAVWVGGLLGIW